MSENATTIRHENLAVRLSDIVTCFRLRTTVRFHLRTGCDAEMRFESLTEAERVYSKVVSLMGPSSDVGCP